MDDMDHCEIYMLIQVNRKACKVYRHVDFSFLSSKYRDWTFVAKCIHCIHLVADLPYTCHVRHQYDHSGARTTTHSSLTVNRSWYKNTMRVHSSPRRIAVIQVTRRPTPSAWRQGHRHPRPCRRPCVVEALYKGQVSHSTLRLDQ